MKLKSYVLAGVMLFLSSVVSANFSAKNITLNGFGSIVGAKVFEGKGYVAEYPNVGIYDGGWEFGQETRLGLQVAAKLSDESRLTMQVMSRSANDYDPEIEWLYYTHNITNSFEIQAGRMRLPVYVYSEYMDVGMAYPWVRIPADTYSLDVVNFNGIKANYFTGTEDIPIRVSLFYGQEKNENSKLMSYLFPPNVSRKYKNIVGLVVDGSYDFLNLRLSYADADMEDSRVSFAGRCSNAKNSREISSGFGEVVNLLDDCRITFLDVAVTVTFGDVSFVGEFNDYDPFYKSYFGSLNYRLGRNTLYVLWSKFDLDGPFEVHDTLSFGVRHDLTDRVSLKADVSLFKDDGFNPFIPGKNPVYKEDYDGDGIREKRPQDGDASIFTLGLDFLF